MKTRILKRKKDKAMKKEFSVLVDWWKKILGGKVEKIELSKRLVDTPCIIVSSEHGYSASMQRIQKAQAFTNQDKASSWYLYGKQTLEINPSHPTVKALKEAVGNSEDPSADVVDTATLLYEAALLESGYTISDPHAFASRMDRVLKYNLNLDRYEKPSPYEPNLEEEPPKAEKTEDKPSEENKASQEESHKDDL